MPKIRHTEKSATQPPLGIVKCRVPREVASYLVARSRERSGEFGTLWALAQAIMTEAFRLSPWDSWPWDTFARPRVDSKIAGSSSGRGFTQMNLFLVQEQKDAIEKLAGDIGISAASFTLTVIFWWINKDEGERKRDPEILEIISSYWTDPAITKKRNSGSI